MEDTEEYVLSVPFDQTVSVYDPDNQLLIDVNYDGIYDNNINEFALKSFQVKLRHTTIRNRDFYFKVKMPVNLKLNISIIPKLVPTKLHFN